MCKRTGELLWGVSGYRRMGRAMAGDKIAGPAEHHSRNQNSRPAARGPDDIRSAG
jgi:hypothetical protein